MTTSPEPTEWETPKLRKRIEWEFHRASEHFEPQGTTAYRRRLAGGRVADTHLDWSPALLQDLALLTMPNPPSESLERIGDTLRKFVQVADPDGDLAWLAHNDAPASILLRSSALELNVLPWELLHIGERRTRLGRRGATTLRYALPAEERVAAPTTPGQGPGRLLLVWSDAGGPVPHEEQAAALTDTFAAADLPFSSVDILPRATLARLGARLRIAMDEGRPYTALHVLAHGRPTGPNGTIGVIFGAPGQPETVTGDALRDKVAPAAQHLELSVLLVCGSANPGEPAGWTGSLAQGLSRAGVRAVIASRTPLSVRGANLLTALLYRLLLGVSEPPLPGLGGTDGEELLNAWLDGRQPPLSLEQTLDVAARVLDASGASSDALSLQMIGEEPKSQEQRPFSIPPYRGLEAFEPRHSRFYFGRAPEVNEICTELYAHIRDRRPRFQIVDGVSGSGKSSLVKAGVVPRLLANRADHWSWVRCVPGSLPLDALQSARAKIPPEGRVLLLVDQLEELFSLVDDTATRDDFVQALWSLAEAPDGRISVLTTIRSDFRGRLGELHLADGRHLDALLATEGGTHTTTLPTMGEAQLREVILEPARAVGLELGPSLARLILDDIRNEPGALPLLEFTLERLWAERRDGRVSEESYVQLGRALGALREHADRTLASLTEVQRQEARRILVRLVATGEPGQPLTRRRLAVQTLVPIDPKHAPDTAALLDRLVQERLLTYTETMIRVGSEVKSERSVEVAHEALIRRWDTLQQWLSEERERLDTLKMTEIWIDQRSKFPGFRLSPDQYSFAQAALARYPLDFDAAMSALIRESALKDSPPSTVTVETLDLSLLPLAAPSPRPVAPPGQPAPTPPKERSWSSLQGAPPLLGKLLFGQVVGTAIWCLFGFLVLGEAAKVLVLGLGLTGLLLIGLSSLAMMTLGYVNRHRGALVAGLTLPAQVLACGFVQLAIESTRLSNRVQRLAFLAFLGIFAMSAFARYLRFQQANAATPTGGA